MVYRYEAWVLKDSQSRSAHGNDVCGDEQRSLSDGPESKLGFLLFRSQHVPADQQRSWVVPSSCSSVCSILLICLKIAENTLPCVSNRRRDKDRLSCAPRIGETFAPGRNSAIAPVIGCIEPSLIFDLVPHSSVLILSASLGSIAIVVFQIGDVLVRRQELDVFLLVVEAAWVSTAGFVP